jgi:hypothetical protein
MNLHSWVWVFREKLQSCYGVGLSDEIDEIFELDKRKRLVDEESVVIEMGDQV